MFTALLYCVDMNNECGAPNSDEEDDDDDEVKVVAEEESSDTSSVGEPEFWEGVTDEEIDEDFDGFSVGSQEEATGSELAVKKLVHLTLLFILLWATHYGVSSNAIAHLIQYMHRFFASLSPFVIANILSYFPPTLYKV